MSPEVLAAIGSLIILLLSANAYFFKGLVDSTNDIKLKLGILIAKHDNTEKTAEKNAIEIERLKVEVLQLKIYIEECTKE